MELSNDMLILGLLWYAVFLFSTTLHEAAHALAALRGGDPTAYHGGQVTLDPRPHVQRERFGMVFVPILSFLLGGWMIGWASTPYDPAWAERYPRRAAWMALAGPAANLLLVILAMIVIRVGMMAGGLTPPDFVNFTRVVDATGGPFWEFVAKFTSVALSLNLLLFVFNLIPMPPLDGSGVLPLILPLELALKIQEFLRQPAFGILGLFIAWKIIGELYQPAQRLALAVLYPGVTYS